MADQRSSEFEKVTQERTSNKRLTDFSYSAAQQEAVAGPMSGGAGHADVADQYCPAAPVTYALF